MASWHALLLLTAVGALSQQQWDRTVVRQGLGSVLLSLAAWQLGGLSARRVEGAVRYGLVATVQKALGEASNHEVIFILVALHRGWFCLKGQGSPLLRSFVCVCVCLCGIDRFNWPMKNLFFSVRVNQDTSRLQL